MRLLVFHADSFAFDTRDGTDTGPASTARTAEREHCLVVFVTVEAGDSTATDGVVASAREEIVAVADQLRTDSVVLYPSASLAADAAGADAARGVLAALDDALVEERDVVRAPLDWRTTFELAAKGHPFAEQFRRVTPADSPTPAADRNRSEWEVALPDGTRCSLRAVLDDPSDSTDDTDATDPPAQETVRAVVERLEGGCNRTAERILVDGSTEHGAAVRESRLVHTGTGTPGPSRFTPRGTFVRDAIVEYARAEAVAAGGVPVETGTLGVRSPGTDSEQASESAEWTVQPGALEPRVRPAVLSALERVGRAAETGPARVYHTATEGVPVGGPGSREQTASTVPELWTATEGLTAAQTELVAQAALVRRVTGALALETVPVLRVTAAFATRHEAWIERLVESFGERVLVERRPETTSPWPVALAFVTVVADRLVETGSVWLTLEGGQAGREGLGFGDWTDGDHRQDGALLCCAPAGSVERATTTAGARGARRDPPRLPTWLAPTQVRLVPTDPDELRGNCHDVAADLEGAGIRVDVDDSDQTVGERLDRAEADWVPYYAVVGRPEAAGEPLEVTVRETGTATELTVGALRERVPADVGDRPQKRQYFPRSVRDQPTVSRE